jgi:hypothetical protein
MAIDALYKDYFQKSKVFLYPLLGMKRGSVAAPRQCYLSWGSSITPEDMKLICVYTKRSDTEYKKFESQVLIKHKRISDYIELENDEVMMTFDFSDLSSDWQHFISGKYSKIDLSLRRKILNHFDKYSGSYPYLESFLFPDKYFSLYATLLGVDENMLREVGELCSPPDLEKETLTAQVLDLENKKILG